MDSKDTSKRGTIIKSINTPLGFFVLALLIVESFLGLVVSMSNFSEEHKFYGLIIGVLMFIIVIAIVSLIVWYKPEHLVYTEEGQLIERGKIPYGTSEKPVDNIDKLKPIVMSVGGDIIVNDTQKQPLMTEDSE
jgi:hypothetical protein